MNQRITDIIRLLNKAAFRLFSFVFGNLVGRFLYSPTYYRKSRWFKRWYSVGWTWIMPDFFGRLLFGKNRGVKWPVSPLCNINMSQNSIEFDLDDLNNFQGTGIYYQAFDEKIIIGKGCFIAQGTGLITGNHDIYDLEQRGKAARIVIGEQSWIGMNSVILPGVELGPHTVAGAGSVVTQSFPEGYMVIAGNPAKVIRTLEREKFQS